ncbi:MauE/DoxX family redox-associated membrane protein [Pedobacter sp. ASV1-7]|uniref:MauE/DoxX family redox-associated membrane protein n=1 Tax=Pedobacter sp. ASV1-7 TaxID=3145237 RepID=UPI0032E91DBD
MDTTASKKSIPKRSASAKEYIFDAIVYLFIILFMYTAASKLFTISSFASTLAKSSLIGNMNYVVAWGIPIVEVIISIVLIFPSFRRVGLYAALTLMVAFTIYLAYMILSDSKLPCHCGGVISTMSWQQHVWFNMGFIALAITGLVINKK